MPDFGYEYHRVRSLSFWRWRLKEWRMARVFRRFGYTEKSWPFGQRDDETNDKMWEMIEFKKRRQPGDKKELLTKRDNPIGLDVNGINVTYDYSDEKALIPTVISIKPRSHGWEVNLFENSMEVIERVEKKNILGKAFKNTYKRLPLAKGLCSEAERKKTEEKKLAFFYLKKIAPGLF